MCAHTNTSIATDLYVVYTYRHANIRRTNTYGSEETGETELKHQKAVFLLLILQQQNRSNVLF